MPAENNRAVAVSFDLDDTLMDHESAVVAGARRFYADHRNVFEMPESDFVTRWVQRIETAYQTIAATVLGRIFLLFLSLPVYWPPGQPHHHGCLSAQRWLLP